MTIITRFLDLFYLPSLETEPTYHRKTKPVKQAPEISHRERLEIQARPIVKIMGSNPDTVEYMSEKLLQALITDYINEVNRR